MLLPWLWLCLWPHSFDSQFSPLKCLIHAAHDPNLIYSLQPRHPTLWPHRINNWSLNLPDLDVIVHPWVLFLPPNTLHPALPGRLWDCCREPVQMSLPLWSPSESLRQHPSPFGSATTLDTFLPFVYSVTDSVGFIDHLLCADHSKALGTEWRIRQMWSPRAMTVKGTDDFESINNYVSVKKYIA